MGAQHDTEVLIVGGGGAGLTASMLLSSYGIGTHLVSRYPQTSNLPKASGLSMKTMEIFRELGIEDAVRALGTPPENMRYAGLYAGFAGSEPDCGRAIARIGAWGVGGQDIDWLRASSVRPANVQQHRLEPVMKARAEALAPDSVRFNQTFLSVEQTAGGVLATIQDRASEEIYQVAARYLLACDGGRAVGPQVGVEMQGHLAVATSVSIHFSADLSRWYRDPETFHATILNPDVGIPCALLPIGPERFDGHSPQWIVHLIAFAGDHRDWDDARAVATLKRCLGLPDLDLQVHVINRWPLDAVVASRFRAGRVFMLGDAAHRNPPTGGHGLNTAIQDAYNLSWKLAEVLRGRAPDALLDTYEAERRPMAQRLVETAYAGWHRNREMAAAIGFGPMNPPAQNWANIRTIWQDGPDGEAARQRVARALHGLVPNFNNLGVAYAYAYGDGAIVSEGEGDISAETLAVYEPSTRPGRSVPDVPVHGLLGRTPLGSLVGGRFVLIAGEDGQAWVEAARIVAAERGMPLDALRIGPDQGDWLDLRDTWRRVRGHGPAGAVLVRPDRFVAWRAMGAAVNPAATLHGVFDTLLQVPQRQAA